MKWIPKGQLKEVIYYMEMKNEKEVRISYLVESSLDRTNPFKRRNHSNLIILGTRRRFGCNRRAQLLAIAHELRLHQQISRKSSSKQKYKVNHI